MADDKTPEQLKAAATAAQNLQRELKRVLDLKKALSDAKTDGVVAGALQEELKLAEAHTEELKKHKDLNADAAKEAAKAAQSDFDRAEAAEKTNKAREAEAKQYERINATLGKAKSALSEQLGMWTSISGITSHILESVVQLDGALKGLGKDTGLVGQFDDAMMGAWESSAGLGATMEDAQAGMTALATTLPRFTSLSAAQAQAMGAQAVAFEKAGIGAQGFANISNVMMETLGKSAGETVAFSDSLVSLSKEIGVSAKKMTSDFESVKNTVVEFGDDGGEIFESLAKQSRALGVEVGELVNVAEGFDTFEDAATRVGKLNAQMGLNLNAVAMMNEQDPTKRIQMIRDQFQMTGKSFETMSRLEKKAVAEMMGVKDVSMAARMLGTEDEFRQATEGQETAAEMAKSFQTMGDKLTSIGQALLTTVMPLLKFGLGVVSAILSVLEFVSNVITGLSKATGGLSSIVISVGIGFLLIKGYLTSVIALIGSATSKLFSFAKGMKKANDSSGGDAGPKGGGMKEKLTDLSKGLKAMGKGGILKGALNLAVAGPALMLASPGIALLSLVSRGGGDAVKSMLTGLAGGLKALAKAGIAGAGVLALSGPAILLAAPGIALLSLVSRGGGGDAVKSMLTGLAGGLKALAKAGIAGAGVLALSGPAILLAAPGIALLSLVSRGGGGDAVKSMLTGLAGGLKALAKAGIAGAGVLALSGPAILLAAPGMAIAAIIGGLGGGPAIKSALSGLASGVAAMAKAMPGILPLALLGAALIPFAFAMGLMSDVGLGTFVGAALGVGLIGLAAAALGAIAPLIFFGALAIGALGLALIPFASAMNTISSVDPSNMSAVATGIGEIAWAAAKVALYSAGVLIGSAALGALGLALIPFASAMGTISSVDPSNIAAIAIGIGDIAWAVAKVGAYSIGVLLGSAALGVLGVSLTSFTKALDQMKSVDVSTLPALALGIGEVAWAVAKLALYSGGIVIGAGALATLGSSLLDFGLGLEMIGSNMEGFTTFLNTVNAIDASGIYSLATAMNALSMAGFALGLAFANPITLFGLWSLSTMLDNMFSADKVAGATALQGAFDGVQNLIQASVEIDPTSIENVEKLVDQVIRVTTEASTKEDVIANLARMLGVGEKSKGEGKTDADNQKTIKLMLNERELGEVVVDLINDRYDLAKG